MSTLDHSRKGRPLTHTSRRAARAAGQPSQPPPEIQPRREVQQAETFSAYQQIGAGAGSSASATAAPPAVPFYQLDPPQATAPQTDSTRQDVSISSFAAPKSSGQNNSQLSMQGPSLGPGPSPMSTVSSHNPPSAPRLDVAEYLDPPLPSLHGSVGLNTLPDSSLQSEQHNATSGDNPSEAHI